MTDNFIASHKVKHLLSHVLVTAGARRWPGTLLGDSGETATGFYADFGLSGLPDETEIAALNDDMAVLLRDFHGFKNVELAPAEALQRFSGQPWKRHLIEVVQELEPKVSCYELDGFLDVCDCAIKSPAELRAVHPEKFLLTGAHPVVWSYRGRDEFFIRVAGELFPAPAPCECCRPAR